MEDSLRAYLNDIAAFPRLPKERRMALLRESRQGPSEKRTRSRQLLVESMLRYAATIVLRSFQPMGAMEFLDLIQEANLALLKALDRIPDQAKSLSGYISQAITWHLYRAMDNQCRTVRLSLEAIAQLQKLARAENLLRQQYDRDPSVADLSAATGISEDRIHLLHQRAEAPVSIDVQEIREAIMSNAFIAPGPAVPTPSEEMDLTELRQSLAETISTLSELERVIIAGRFGLSEDGLQSPQDLARRFKVSQDAIKKIESRALQRLKHPDRQRSLKDFEFAA